MMTPAALKALADEHRADLAAQNIWYRDHPRSTGNIL